MQHVVRHPTPPFLACDGALEVHQVPVWQDNLVWLLRCVETGETAIVDGPEAGPVLEYAASKGLHLTTVLTTHTHPDHIGIHRELASMGRLDAMHVVASAAAADPVPGVAQEVVDGDEVRVGAVRGVVMRTDGHQTGHVCYLFGDVLCCGDTLFAGGCGYLFDGPADAMYASLMRLAALPGDTWVCCAHEYTQDNLRFAASLEPGNDALAQRIDEVGDVRASGGCTLPSRMSVEQATNPFLRPGSPELFESVRSAMPDEELSSPNLVFAAARSMKDGGAYKAPGAPDPFAHRGDV